MAYIDVEKLLKELTISPDGTKIPNPVKIDLRLLKRIILRQPTADVQEVKRGHWENVVVFNDTCIATCSNCRQKIRGAEWSATAFKFQNEFCRNCGADMRGDAE